MRVSLDMQALNAEYVARMEDVLARYAGCRPSGRNQAREAF